MALRVVGGEFRGRGLQTPPGLATRPTSDRARQAVFNILEHAGWAERALIDEARVLDAFAGTGAMGIEALSRGAQDAVFIEQDRAALQALKGNIATFGLGGRTQVIVQDATRLAQKPLHILPRTLVFLDPPYGKNLGTPCVAALQRGGWLAAGAVIVMEMAKKEPEPLPEGFDIKDTRDYGVARVTFAVYAGD